MQMDIFSEILSTTRMRGTLYFRTQFGPPFSVQVPQHRHVARFHLLVRGECWIQVSGEDPLLLKPGDLVVVPHGAEHVLSDMPNRPAASLDAVIEESGFSGSGALVYGDAEAGTPASLVCGHFEFDEDAMHPMIEALPAFIHIEAEDTGNNLWLDSVMRIASVETESDLPGSEAVVHRLSEIIFIQVIRAYVARAGDSARCLAAIADPHISRAIGAFHNAPGSDWTLESLAKEAALSRTSFVERFGTLMNMTPQQYLRRWRMIRARRDIIDTSDATSQVARRYGYRSDSAFNKTFKQEFGMGPGRLRRHHRRAGLVAAG